MFNLFGRSLVRREVTWQSSSSLEELLQLLPEEVSDRKRQLFGCACYRRIWPAVWEPAKQAIELTERRVDGLISAQEMNAVLAGKYLYWVTPDSLPDCARAARERAWYDGRPQRRPWAPGRDTFLAEEEAAQAGLLRHIVGNPFREVSSQHWSGDLIRLAEVLYQGADVAFALADALLEEGRSELAEHFRAETWHPKGCWVVDAMTGRT